MAWLPRPHCAAESLRLASQLQLLEVVAVVVVVVFAVVLVLVVVYEVPSEPGFVVEPGAAAASLFFGVFLLQQPYNHFL